MKPLSVAVLVTLHAWGIYAVENGVVALHERLHARDVHVKRDGRDCGTWVMYCGGVPNAGPNGERGQSAEGACNNACYYINFLAEKKGEYTAKYDPDESNDHNRQHSGCQPQNGNDATSICNVMPFSQRFHDDFERQPDVKDQKFNCDEFPMAAMSQSDFTPGKIRNSLRCIDGDQNSAGGAQLNSFIEGTGDSHTKRNPDCKGKLDKGDTFKVEFNYEGVTSQGQLGYCKTGDTDPDQNADQHQFYLTDLKTKRGREDFPYDYDKDNHYAIANNGKNILQCRIDMARTSGDSYQATVYDTRGAEINSGAKELTDNNMKLQIPGKNGYMSTWIQRTDEMGKAGTKGSKVFFYYGEGLQDILNAPKSSLWTDFEWFSDYVGNDNSFKKYKGPDDIADGGYCKVPNIEENEDGDRQEITCYFPCQQPDGFKK